MISATVTEKLDIGGLSLSENRTITSDSQVVQKPTVPAAKTGTLSTRTNNTDGTLTMTAGHTIVTGQIIDLYWATGSRYGVVVGTVATNSVPISGGAGDNLPIATTAIFAGLRVTLTLGSLSADKIQAIGLATQDVGYFSIENASTVLLVKKVGAGGVWGWALDNGDVNPLAGTTPTKILVSHQNIAAKVMQFGIAINN